MEETIDEVVAHLDEQSPGDVVGVYLYGSAVVSGLRPDSDVDLLVVTRRPLSTPERRALVNRLLKVSGWRGHAERFPDAARGQPVDLTAIAVDQLRRWRPMPRRDFQYGEWLREDFVKGDLPGPTEDPDVAIVIATAQTAHRILRGPALGDLAAPVPPDVLRDAALTVIPDLLDEIVGDERNTLLTLARILVTLETGHIVSKDSAAERIAPTLDARDRDLLERARAGYLGLAADDWAKDQREVVSVARSLARRARGHTED